MEGRAVDGEERVCGCPDEIKGGLSSRKSFKREKAKYYRGI